MKPKLVSLSKFAITAAITAVAFIIPVAANAATTTPTLTYSFDIVGLGTLILNILIWLAG